MIDKHVIRNCVSKIHLLISIFTILSYFKIARDDFQSYSVTQWRVNFNIFATQKIALKIKNKI